MSNDSIKNINNMRMSYNSISRNSYSSETVKELQEIKTELQIANELKANSDEPTTNAVNSPYLPDQKFYKKEVVLDSPTETNWKKDLPSYEETHAKLVSYNIKKLNIL